MNYISLGSTCCVTQQIKNHNLRKHAYPFDWVRITNLNNISKLLENKFIDFLEYDSLEFVEYSKKFSINNVKGSNIYKNKYCGFYHEFHERLNSNNYKIFYDKYKRRIDRLFYLLKSNQEITFIREELNQVKISKINRLRNILLQINPYMKFKIIIITNDERYKNMCINNIIFYFNNDKISHWTRPELDWNEILKN